MKRFSLISITLAALVALSACETVEGAGRDLQMGGQAVSEVASETQAEM